MTANALGVVVAMAWEARGLDHHAHRVRVAGPGAERSTVAARRLVEEGAAALVSWGVATGLDPEAMAGDLLVPAFVQGADGRRQAVERAWHTRFLERARSLRPLTGELVESAEVLADPLAKEELRRSSGAVGADMESAAVLRVAADAGVPGLVVRAVLDPLGMPLPVAWIRTVGTAGRIRPGPLLAAAVRPWLWPSGVRLAQQRACALRTLRAAAPLIDG